MAQASPDPGHLLATLRDDLLEIKPGQSAATYKAAPSEASAENAGSSAQLDDFIDRAPVAVHQADAYAPLRALLLAQQPDASLEVFATRPPLDSVYVALQTGFVVSSSRAWDEDAVRQALTQALMPNLTTGRLGVNWEKHSSADGQYFALDGAVPLYEAVNSRQLLLANDSILMDQLIARSHKSRSAQNNDSVTYAAVFRHAQEQNNFRRLMAQLDLAGQRGTTDQAVATAGESSAFFSGNVASFSRVFSRLDSERIEEKDQGAKVLQTVTYQWTRK
jgi:hypothetical protein